MLTDETVRFFLMRMLMEYVPSSDFGMGEIAYWTMANEKDGKEQAKNDIRNLFFKEQNKKIGEEETEECIANHTMVLIPILYNNHYSLAVFVNLKIKDQKPIFLHLDSLGSHDTETIFDKIMNDLNLQDNEVPIRLKPPVELQEHGTNTCGLYTCLYATLMVDMKGWLCTWNGNDSILDEMKKRVVSARDLSAREYKGMEFVKEHINNFQNGFRSVLQKWGKGYNLIQQ